jgi:hypothetical protein
MAVSGTEKINVLIVMGGKEVGNVDFIVRAEQDLNNVRTEAIYRFGWGEYHKFFSFYKHGTNIHIPLNTTIQNFLNETRSKNSQKFSDSKLDLIWTLT